MSTALDRKARGELKMSRMVPTYRAEEVSGFEKGLDRTIEELIRLIRRKYVSTDAELKLMDFARMPQLFNLDVLTKIAFGAHTGNLNMDADVFGYIRAMHDYLPVLDFLADLPFLRRIVQMPWIRHRIEAKKTDKAGMGTLLRYVYWHY